MRAITVCQPYASLIISGEQRVENRKRPFAFRGTIAIHAGLGRGWLDTWHGPVPDPMPFGYVLGTVRIIDCLSIEEIQKGIFDSVYPWLRDHEHASGPFCLVLDAPFRFSVPRPAKGQQGIWFWAHGGGDDVGLL